MLIGIKTKNYLLATLINFKIHVMLQETGN